ncbi:hypothetical protein [Muricoccus radiodurans]|uniref:hypothetical protein n=1 Tax=Muricoccus radiodurans TaxID=2231721 RepID=UPI003CF9E9D6
MSSAGSVWNEGWAVIRAPGHPWHFAGFYATRDEADDKALEMGPDYRVRFGMNRQGSDAFVWSSVNNTCRA